MEGYKHSAYDRGSVCGPFNSQMPVARCSRVLPTGPTLELWAFNSTLSLTHIGRPLLTKISHTSRFPAMAAAWSSSLRFKGRLHLLAVSSRRASKSSVSLDFNKHRARCVRSWFACLAENAKAAMRIPGSDSPPKRRTCTYYEATICACVLSHGAPLSPQTLTKQEAATI